MSAHQLSRIAVLNDPIQAEVMRGLLEAQGIKVMLSKEAASTVYGLTAGAFSEVEVFVPESQAEEAKRIINESYGEVGGSED